MKAASIFVFRFDSEDAPPLLRLALKMKINAREHFAVPGLVMQRVPGQISLVQGRMPDPSYGLDELLDTKSRALYQRKKGRGLFDLAIALRSRAVDPARIVGAFQAYMSHGGHRVMRAQFEQNLAQN